MSDGTLRVDPTYQIRCPNDDGYIPFVFQDARLLAARSRPSHIEQLCSWGLEHLPPTSILKSIGYIPIEFQGFPNQRMDLLDNQQKRVNMSWQRNTTWGQLQSRLYQEKVEHFMDFGSDRQFWYGSLAGLPCLLSINVFKRQALTSFITVINQTILWCGEYRQLPTHTSHRLVHSCRVSLCTESTFQTPLWPHAPICPSTSS